MDAKGQPRVQSIDLLRGCMTAGAKRLPATSLVDPFLEPIASTDRGGGITMWIMRIAILGGIAVLLVAHARAQPAFVGRPARVEAGVRVAAPIGFRAVGWLDDVAGLRVRASADGVAWTEWQSVDHDADRLAYFGDLQHYIEVDAAGATDPVRMLFIDPGTSEPRSFASTRGAEANPGPPAVVVRAQWGCTPATCPAKDPPVYTAVTHLIVHHTAGANASSDWAAVVRSIWVLHVMGNGWNDIGYNYLIDPTGALYEGRAGGDGVMGAHFSGVNGGTMGVSMIGTYSTLPLRDVSLETLRSALAWQAAKWNVDPSGKRLHVASGLSLDTISGHRDANTSRSASGTTECPGNGVYTVLPGLRRDVERAVAANCVIVLSARSACVANGGAELAIRVSTAEGCRWQAASDFDWLRVKSSEGGAVQLSIAANGGARRSAFATIGGHMVPFTQSAASEGELACATYNGIVSIVGGEQPIAAGSWVSIYGTGLASQTLIADQTALPKSLGSTSVTVNGRAAAIGYASAGQLNVQVPPETGIGATRLVVTSSGVAGPETLFAVTEAAPVIYSTSDSRAIAQNYDGGGLNSREAPVQAGKIIFLYVSGVGAVRGFPATGTITPSALFPATLPWSATIGGKPAAGLFLGLAPGLVGIYQANLVVPAELTSGDQPVVITVAGASSAPALLAVAALGAMQ